MRRVRNSRPAGRAGRGSAHADPGRAGAGCGRWLACGSARSGRLVAGDQMPALEPAHRGPRVRGAAAEFERNLDPAGYRQIAPDGILGAANAQALALAQHGARQGRDRFAVDRGGERAAGDGHAGAAAGDRPFAAAMRELDGCGIDRIADQRVGDGVAFEVHRAGAGHAVSAPADAAGVLDRRERPGRDGLERAGGHLAGDLPVAARRRHRCGRRRPPARCRRIRPRRSRGNRMRVAGPEQGGFAAADGRTGGSACGRAGRSRWASAWA